MNYSIIDMEGHQFASTPDLAEARRQVVKLVDEDPSLTDELLLLSYGDDGRVVDETLSARTILEALLPLQTKVTSGTHGQPARGLSRPHSARPAQAREVSSGSEREPTPA